MDRQNNTKALVESSILTAVAVVLIIMSLYIPAFILIGAFIWPIPITFIYIRHGVKFSLLSLLVTYIITTMISDPVSAFGLVAIYGLLGVVLGYCVATKKSVSVSIVIMSVAAFLSTIAMFKMVTLVTGQDIISQGINTLSQSTEAVKSMYLKMGISKESVDKVMAAMPDPKSILLILPALLIAYSIFTSFICYILTEKILKRFKYQMPKIKPLSEWYIPARVSFGIILIFGISVLLMISGFKNGQNYFLNANIIFVFSFTINALGFISSFLEKKGVVKPLKWIIIIFCLFTPIGNYLYLIGIFDYIFDYRKLDPYRRRPVK